MNRVVHVTLELVWSGEADVYDIPRPDLSALSDFEIVGQSLSASRQGHENLLRYEFDLKPAKEGTYDLSRIQATYFEKGRDIPLAAALPSAAVTVGPPEFLSGYAKAGIAAGATVAVALAGGFFVKRARSKSSSRKSADAERTSRLRADFLQEVVAARRLLIEGQPSSYIEKLCRLAEADPLRPHVGNVDELQALAESLKFGGHSASPDQLKWAEKQVKEAIEKAFPSRTQDESEEMLKGA